MNHNKTELKEAYKQMKPEMGVFVVRNKLSNRCFLGASTDIKSMFNRIGFQLKMGGHPVKSLQKDWRDNGEDAFVFEVVETLAYSEDEKKSDYREDLKMLKTLWLEKIKTVNTMTLY